MSKNVPDDLLNYKGICYYCGEEKMIYAKPLARVRLCKDCLAFIGHAIVDCFDARMQQEQDCDAPLLEHLGDLFYTAAGAV